jgi:hypothetical protein
LPVLRSKENGTGALYRTHINHARRCPIETGTNLRIRYPVVRSTVVGLVWSLVAADLTNRLPQKLGRFNAKAVESR